MIDSQHPIEVIHFMLNQLGQGAFGRKAVAHPGAVLMFNDHADVAAKPHHQIREREAVIPQFERFGAFFQIDGIDQLVAAAVDLKENHAEQLADLDGADAAAEAAAAAEVGECVLKILENAPRDGGISGG